MVQAAIEVVFQSGFQAVGWLVFKCLTLGRYQGFQTEDMAAEGAVGLATVFALGYVAYRWL